jgi:hypothetical protein
MISVGIHGTELPNTALSDTGNTGNMARTFEFLSTDRAADLSARSGR